MKRQDTVSADLEKRKQQQQQKTFTWINLLSCLTFQNSLAYIYIYFFFIIMQLYHIVYNCWVLICIGSSGIAL